MQLRYTNLAAVTQDIQIPAIQIEPMVYGGIYEVVEALGYILLTLPHWERVQNEEAVTPVIAPVNELRQVKGIGAKIAKTLSERGISTLAALVGLTAEEVNTLLDGALDYVTVDMITGWQTHARQLMEE